MKRSDKNEKTREMSIILQAMRTTPVTLIQGVKHVCDDVKLSIIKIVIHPFSVVGSKSVLKFNIVIGA